MTDCYLAIDVGGTKLAAGVVDEQGGVLVRDRVPTPGRDVWSALAKLTSRVMAAAPTVPVSVGVGCGGPMDPAQRTVSPLHIPSWVKFPLATEVEGLTQLPVVVDNDAKALALAEHWCGAAAGHDHFIGVVVGTGVGGGIVSNGRLLQGRTGNAGHIGHVVVEPEGRPCRCGGRGCLEAYCSGPAIAAETGRPPQRAPSAYVERTGLLMGRAIASVASICDLRLAVIGGSVAMGFGAQFFAVAQSEARARGRLTFLREIDVLPAALGSNASLVGAAALARAARG